MQKEKKWWNDPERNMPIKSEIKYFKMSEFDSPDLPGSGKENMNMDLVHRLDQARSLAGVPFKITSGFRTKKYNLDLEKRGYHISKKSQHLKGNAVDISTPNSSSRYKIMRSLMDVGFTSFGIGESFIHVDTRSQEVVWDYY
jgi:zinc D-Ala-D-Ala carboxypeptidase